MNTVQTITKSHDHTKLLLVNKRGSNRPPLLTSVVLPGNGKTSVIEILDVDPDPDDIQNLMVTCFSNDKSLVIFS